MCNNYIFVLAFVVTYLDTDSSFLRGKSSPRGRGRGHRSSAVDPTAMDIDPYVQVPHVPVQPVATMAAYIPGISGPMSPPFRAFHHQTSYIPNQSTMYGQFCLQHSSKPPSCSHCTAYSPTRSP